MKSLNGFYDLTECIPMRVDFFGKLRRIVPLEQIVEAHLGMFE